MWVAAKIPFGLVLVVIFLAVIGARKILNDVSPEDGYRTELTVLGKAVLGLLFGVSILFAFTLLLVFVVVLLRS